MPIYPPAPPVLSGDVLTVSRFLQNPAWVQRRLRTLTEQRFISDAILTGRYEITGGAIGYDISESIYADAAPESVPPGSQYPRGTTSNGAAALAVPTKWGKDYPVTDEQIKRYKMDAVNRTFLKAGNSLVRTVDLASLAAIGAAVTQSVAATASWATVATADPFYDVLNAEAVISALDQGYDPQTVVLTDALYARLVGSQRILANLSRESTNNVTSEGEITKIAGMDVWRTQRLPSGVTAIVLDRNVLGGLAYERLESPEYSGDPANGVETWARRNPVANDEWLLRVRRPIVPIVQEPASACVITGA